MSKSNSNHWHWDNDRHRWVYMGPRASENPVYRWELENYEMIYTNDLMMRAIDIACDNMTEFPDVADILDNIARSKEDD